MLYTLTEETIIRKMEEYIEEKEQLRIILSLIRINL